MRVINCLWFLTLLLPVLGSVQITTIYSSSYELNTFYAPTPFLMTDVNPNFAGSGSQYTIAMWVNHDNSWNNTMNLWRLTMRISEAPTGQDFGEARVFMHAADLESAPTSSPMIAASSNDQYGVTQFPGWNANNDFLNNYWTFFAYSVDTSAGNQAFLTMYVADPANTPVPIFNSISGKMGLYSITGSARIYMGADDTGNSSYYPCFCQASVSLYSSTYYSDKSDLFKLAYPESDYIEDIIYDSTTSTSTSHTFTINHEDRTGVTSPQTGTAGTVDSSGNPQQIPLPGGFNMFRCLGNQILSYPNGDLTTGIYLEFMIRPNASDSESNNTIFSYWDNSTGKMFFSVYFTSSTMKVSAQVLLSSGTMSGVSSSNSLTAGWWSSIKVFFIREYLFGYSYYNLWLEVDGIQTSTKTFSSPGSPTSGTLLDSRFGQTLSIIATWCAEYSGSISTLINYAAADVAMFRLVKTAGNVYPGSSTTMTSCTNALGSSTALMFCEECSTGYYRYQNINCTDPCPSTYMPLPLGVCGSLSAVGDIVPCNVTTQCTNPFITCANVNLTCSPCQADADCDAHTGYTTCLNGFCRGIRQITSTFDVSTLTFTLTPDSPFVINDPPIDNYINLTINGVKFYPQSLNYTTNYTEIQIVLPLNSLPLGTDNAVITIENLTAVTSESVILEYSSITGTYDKPHQITYSLILADRPQIFQMVFYNYSFNTIKDLKNYLKFSFDGFADSPLTPNDTNLTLISSNTLQIQLNFTVNESIYSQGLTVDVTDWNAVDSTTNPQLYPTTQTAYVEPNSDGTSAFYFSRVVKITAIGTASFCFLIDLLTSCSRSSYVRFYAMTQRIAILQYINIEYNSITTGFFQEMDLDFSSMPSFFISITNTTSLDPQKNVTILNMPNYIGYDNIFLQGYGGTALLQGLAGLIGIVLSIIYCCVHKKKANWIQYLEKVRKIFVFNLIFLIFFSTTPKLVLGLSIFFQNANLFSAYASGSFAVGCIYVLAFVTVYMILYRNAKNEKDKASKRFFGKIEILRHDYKDTRAGRAAPMVFTTVNFLTALFTGVVGASGQAQAAMLTIFPFFAVVYWGITKGLVEKGELIIMIFSEACFIIAGIFHAVLSVYNLDSGTRLNVGWGMMAMYGILIFCNMLFRAYGLVKGIKDFITKKSPKPADEDDEDEVPAKDTGAPRDTGAPGDIGWNKRLRVDIPENVVLENPNMSGFPLNYSGEVALNELKDIEPQYQKSRLVKIDKSALQRDDFMPSGMPPQRIDRQKPTIQPQTQMNPIQDPRYQPQQQMYRPQGPFLPKVLNYPTQGQMYPPADSFLPQEQGYPSQGQPSRPRKQTRTMKPQYGPDYPQPNSQIPDDDEWNPNQNRGWWDPNHLGVNPNQQGMDPNQPGFNNNQKPISKSQQDWSNQDPEEQNEIDPDQGKTRFRSNSRKKPSMPGRNRSRIPSQGVTDQPPSQDETYQPQSEIKDRKRPTQMEQFSMPKKKTIVLEADKPDSPKRKPSGPDGNKADSPKKKANTFVIS